MHVNAQVFAEAFDALAHLFVSEGTLRRALIAWPSRAPDGLRRPLQRSAQRLTLGAPLSYAIGSLGSTLGHAEQVLSAIVKLHLATGADPGELLRAEAHRLRSDDTLHRRNAAGIAGVRASARLVGALPIVCLLVLPLERSPLADTTGVALIACGSALSAAGFLWIRRAIPTLELGDPVAGVCGFMAAASRAGLPTAVAFEAAISIVPRTKRGPFERALRLIGLGSPPARALVLTGDDDLAELGRIIDRSWRAGTPLAPALERHAQMRRARAAADAERAMRRAPVRMLPALALCVLPAFVLLGLGPFVREFLHFL